MARTNTGRCWTFLLTSAPEVQLMVASSTPAGTPVFRFHAVRSPTDRDDDLSVFFFLASAESAASSSGAGGSSAKRSLFVLDSLTGILAVAADVNLQDRVTRNKEPDVSSMSPTDQQLCNAIRNDMCDLGITIYYSRTDMKPKPPSESFVDFPKKPFGPAAQYERPDSLKEIELQIPSCTDWCFGPNRSGSATVSTMLRVFENRPKGTDLIDLSYRSANFKQFCPDLRMSYSLHQFKAL
ncbi:hypothetical protein DAPPUDRAFT_233272 [Daphnia pulex]|uniref:Uncharacterized protein n=1 Tax=Daphnia pulex TaxID=6669 RepID=E9FTN7_DAPPU|nr:hypothetical protein DAPPUDRAFT_233272 [Daphnia pulex]|eukprot:EFX89396.1 hypothetical protein DAPPUDRAFT_233272 [Daphnia pulex]